MSQDVADSGGPAFPHSELEHAHGMHSVRSPGMSQRDYFAAALQGLLASGPHDCGPNGLAHDAYLHADAMIKARGA